jgi:hypothetical protein
MKNFNKDIGVVAGSPSPDAYNIPTVHSSMDGLTPLSPAKRYKIDHFGKKSRSRAVEEFPTDTYLELPEMKTRVIKPSASFVSKLDRSLPEIQN